MVVAKLGIYHYKLNLLGISIFNWVFVKMILGNTTLSQYFLYNINCFNWVSSNIYDFVALYLKNNWVFQKNNWINNPKKQRICSSVFIY